MKNPLYIHLHIPKTAGYTFRYHISKNLKKDEQLFLCYEFLGLDLFKPPLDYLVYKKAAFKLVKSLTKEKREKIKIIHGHTVPYGIHELFDRETRYFSFVRSPIDRTISIYNHLSYLNKIEGHEIRKHCYYQDYLLIDGKDPGFEVWLKEKYVSDINFSHFSLAGYLKEFGYLSGDISEDTIMSALAKFYFLGQTENFSRESLYFFRELNMYKYFIDQNISHRQYGEKVTTKIKSSISVRNKFDQFLYKKASQMNATFKLNHPEFQKSISLKMRERMMLLSFTQVLFAPRQSAMRILSYLFKGKPLVSDPTYFSSNS